MHWPSPCRFGVNKSVNTISLLPPRIKAQHNKFYRRRFYLVIAFSVIALIIMVNAVLAVLTIGTNLKLDKLKNDRRAMESYIESTGGVLEAQMDVENLEKIIEKAMGKVPDWGNILIDTGKPRPNGIVIDVIKGSLNESQVIITINGRGYSQKDLGNYMAALENLHNITEVKCNYTRQSSLEDATSLEFEIVLYMDWEEPYKLNGGSGDEANKDTD